VAGPLLLICFETENYSSSEDEDAGDAEDEEDTGSTVSVSQLSEEVLRKRIATVKSMIEVANKELFQGRRAPPQ
jgi:hypothetical protein